MTRSIFVSIIVPVFNEVAHVESMLRHLAAWRDRSGVEVLIADGGSNDGTAERLTESGFVVLRTARGRATQMNTGAARATGAVLMFLHADTRLQNDALESLRNIAVEGDFWGRFDIRITGASPMLAVIAWFMNWRSRLSGIATGDQAIFVRRRLFESVGGFPAQPLMEDVELSRRLRRRVRPVCLRDRATTSGRRWEVNGVWRTIFLMWWLRFSYSCGAPPARLARLYDRL